MQLGLYGAAWHGEHVNQARRGGRKLYGGGVHARDDGEAEQAADRWAWSVGDRGRGGALAASAASAGPRIRPLGLKGRERLDQPTSGAWGKGKRERAALFRGEAARPREKKRKHSRWDDGLAGWARSQERGGELEEKPLSIF